MEITGAHFALQIVQAHNVPAATTVATTTGSDDEAENADIAIFSNVDSDIVSLVTSDDSDVEVEMELAEEKDVLENVFDKAIFHIFLN